MTLRELAFAGVLLLSGGVITTGVCLVSVPLALVVGGALAAGWAWLVLSE